MGLLHLPKLWSTQKWRYAPLTFKLYCEDIAPTIGDNCNFIKIVQGYYCRISWWNCLQDNKGWNSPKVGHWWSMKQSKELQDDHGTTTYTTKQCKWRGTTWGELGHPKSQLMGVTRWW
jgi:hypothetical protein